ncbi:MAG TPA: chemotaxis protein CheB [Ktedonobacteraceae bacterium]|nr:chemotaxis protein CheB [Ktedonobacteraceae bacterium]
MNEKHVQKENGGDPESASVPHTEHASEQGACRVVGIGASAGGLEAFTRLLEGLPTTTGMASVFVQRLDPTHPSLLPGLLARATTMPVREIRDGMPSSRWTRASSYLDRSLLLAQSVSPLMPSCAPWHASKVLKRLACCFLEPPPMAHKVSRPSRPREVSPLRKMRAPLPSHTCLRAPLPRGPSRRRSTYV